MNKLIILIVLLFSHSLSAAHFFPVGKEGANKTYNSKEDCKEKEGQDCYNILGKDLSYMELKVVESDDLENPIMREKYNVVACSDFVDCGAKIEALNLPKLNAGTPDEKPNYSSICDQGTEDKIYMSENKLMPGWSYYCTGIIGYPKKSVSTLVENAAKKAEFDTAQAAATAKRVALAEVGKAMAFGEEVKKEVYLINAAKGLTGTQLVQFMNEFSMIEKLLSVGAIDNAKTQIEAIQVGPLMSATDKQYILDKINAYLGN